MRYYIQKVWLPLAEDSSTQYVYDCPDDKQVVSFQDFHPGVQVDPATVTVVLSDLPVFGVADSVLDIDHYHVDFSNGD